MTLEFIFFHFCPLTVPPTLGAETTINYVMTYASFLEVSCGVFWYFEIHLEHVLQTSSILPDSYEPSPLCTGLTLSTVSLISDDKHGKQLEEQSCIHR